jgi:hypothetical protein
MISILVALYSVNAFGVNAFHACVHAFSEAGNPNVEIHVQGEVHSKSELAKDLIQRAERGEIFLLVEGAPFGASKTLSQIRQGEPYPITVNEKGPIFGIEHPLTTLLHELFQSMYLPLVSQGEKISSRDFYSVPANEAMWLRLVVIAAQNPGYFKTIQAASTNKDKAILNILNSLVALGSAEAVLKHIRESSVYPNTLQAHASVVRLFLQVGLDGLEKHFPFLAPWLETTRSSLDGRHLEFGFDAVGDFVLVRNFFICQYVAKIMTGNFNRNKKFVLLLGVLHVADAARTLEGELEGLENVHVTYDENNQALDPASILRDAELFTYIMSKEAPRLP